MELAIAKGILKDNIYKDGLDRSSLGYMFYENGEEKATIDGEFTADELEAVAIYMRSTQSETVDDESRQEK